MGARDDGAVLDRAERPHGLADLQRGSQAMVVRYDPRRGQRDLSRLTLGLLPYTVPDPNSAPRPIYARAETVATHPMFEDAFAHRRAIVPLDRLVYPASTSSRSHRRIEIGRPDGQPMACAALWEVYRWPDRIERTFCLITVPAVAPVNLHADRMPVVLEPEAWSSWLGELPSDPMELLVPSGSLGAWESRLPPR